MAASQRHGFLFEDLLRGGAPAPPGGALFDIPEPGDGGPPVSVKSCRLGDAGQAWLAFGDAIRFHGTTQDFRLVVVGYLQQGGEKIVGLIREIPIAAGAQRRLFGTIGRQDLLLLDEEIKAIPPGRRPDARRATKALRDALVALHGDVAIRLAPKIDSGRQRRLQCAAALADVETLLGPARNHAAWGDLRVGVRIQSPPRARRSRSEGAPDALPSAASMDPGSPTT